MLTVSVPKINSKSEGAPVSNKEFEEHQDRWLDFVIKNARGIQDGSIAGEWPTIGGINMGDFIKKAEDRANQGDPIMRMGQTRFGDFEQQAIDPQALRNTNLNYVGWAKDFCKTKGRIVELNSF